MDAIADADGHELITVIVSIESRIRILVSFKTCNVVELMVIKSAEDQTPHVDSQRLPITNIPKDRNVVGSDYRIRP
ncbi:hypothetical protein TNCV_2217861 [Trichonephila clavipes]|nr:hypothetical protein TNCV_2217861 [Trichonephila clavipes]